MKQYLFTLQRRMNDKQVHPLLAATIIILIVLTTGISIVNIYKHDIAKWSLSTFHDETLVTILYKKELATNASVNFELGNYFFGDSATYDTTRAEKYFKQAILLDPKFPRAHYQLSRVYFVTGLQDKALQAINTEIQLFPDYKRSFYIRGLVYGYTGELPEAVSDFKTFLAWKPESWAGHNDLAWIYFQQGDFYHAYTIAEEGLSFAPGNPWLLNSLGVALKNSNNEEEAAKAFKVALLAIEKMSPSDWGRAYPGNDPDFYNTGFQSMKSTIEKNLELLGEKK